MKVALILSGLNRSAIHCYPLLYENLLKHYDVDIYFHTYDQTHVSVNSSSVQEVDENNIQFIIDELKPKDYIIEDYNKIKPEINSKFGQYEIKCDPERSISMFYGLNKAFSLIKEDIYDVYIRSRFDLMLHQFLDLSNYKSDFWIPNPVANKSTYTPDGIDYYSYVHDSYGIIDTFAIGNYKDMKTYCSCFERLDEYCLTRKLYFHPEYLTLQNLLINEINIKRFDIDFCLYRKMF